MNEDDDPIMGAAFRGKPTEQEIELVKKLVGFENFTLSEKPVCDLKRKIALARILPLLLTGNTYDEISEKLHVGRSTVYEILRLYHKAIDQNELVDVYWWGLFFQMLKNKPEIAFNALTQLKLKNMSLSAPPEAKDIMITWMKNEEAGNEAKPL